MKQKRWNPEYYDLINTNAFTDGLQIPSRLFYLYLFRVLSGPVPNAEKCPEAAPQSELVNVVDCIIQRTVAGLGNCQFSSVECYFQWKSARGRTENPVESKMRDQRLWNHLLTAEGRSSDDFGFLKYSHEQFVNKGLIGGAVRAKRIIL